MHKVLSLAVGLIAAGSAFAGAVYDNPYNVTADEGDCSFSSDCAATAGRGNDFAAQLFTLGSGATITSAGFTELDLTQLVGPSSANWAFYTDASGLPGTLLFSGSAAISGDSSAGLDNSLGFYVDTYTFNIPSVVLSAGTYFFALQTTTTTFATYLAEGTTDSGAAETMNGGSIWAPGYEGIGGVAVELFSGTTAVPEPATLGFAVLGLGLLGLMRRRKAC